MLWTYEIDFLFLVGRLGGGGLIILTSNGNIYYHIITAFSQIHIQILTHSVLLQQGQLLLFMLEAKHASTYHIK